MTASTAAAVVELDPTDWASVRAQFALRADVAHFSAFTLAAHPRPVAEAIARHRDGLDADTHDHLLEHQRELEEAVPVAAAH